MKKAIIDLSAHELLEIPYIEEKLNGEMLLWQLNKERQIISTILKEHENLAQSSL